ncbi:hypothetical protein Tco_0438681 [Tanacetum coccineum]
MARSQQVRLVLGCIGCLAASVVERAKSVDVLVGTSSPARELVFKKRDEVKLDLWHNGFIRGYTTWYAHGERKCRRAETGECSEPIEEDNGVGCTQMILDIHNATFQSHRDTQEEQAPNSFAKQYYEMLEADDEPLYEGCQKFLTLEAATRLLNWKAECNVPEATYNRALSLFKDMLPGGNKLLILS